MGTVYQFGNATNFGSASPQSSAVTSAVADPAGNGYWILFANGSVSAFGSAPNLGGVPSSDFNGIDQATTIFATADGQGYWVASASGGVFAIGDAPYDGSMAGAHLNGLIIAATGW